MKVVDLSYSIHPDMPLFPGMTKPVFTKMFSIPEWGFREINLQLASHTGTHLDCPAHMLEDGLTLDSLPVSSFLGKGLVVDCRSCRGEITLQHVKNNLHKEEDTAFILLYTGWSRKWGKEGYFSGYPVLTQEAAAFLTGLSLKGIGADVISVDAPDSRDFPIHHTFFQANMLVVENLTGLEDLLNRGFLFISLPLPIKGGEGSPVRALAVITGEYTTGDVSC